MIYAEFSARAIEALSEMSHLPTETIFSSAGVVVAESMSYLEATLALLL